MVLAENTRVYKKADRRRREQEFERDYRNGAAARIQAAVRGMLQRIQRALRPPRWLKLSDHGWGGRLSDRGWG